MKHHKTLYENPPQRFGTYFNFFYSNGVKNLAAEEIQGRVFKPFTHPGSPLLEPFFPDFTGFGFHEIDYLVKTDHTVNGKIHFFSKCYWLLFGRKPAVVIKHMAGFEI